MARYGNIAIRNALPLCYHGLASESGLSWQWLARIYWQAAQGGVTMAGRNKGKVRLDPASVAAELAKPLPPVKASDAQRRAILGAAVPAIKAERDKGLQKVKGKRGPKSTYTPERFNAICDDMTDGIPLKESLAAHGLAGSTFRGWLEEEGEEGVKRRALYARARVALADWAFGEALAVPQKLLAMAMDPAADKPVDSAMVGAARLVTDSLKWYAERLNPGAYADTKAPPPTVTVNNNSLTLDARALDPGQRDSLRQLLLAAKGGDA